MPELDTEPELLPVLSWPAIAAVTTESEQATKNRPTKSGNEDSPLFAIP
jgi:hypothetical protein